MLLGDGYNLLEIMIGWQNQIIWARERELSLKRKD